MLRSYLILIQTIVHSLKTLKIEENRTTSYYHVRNIQMFGIEKSDVVIVLIRLMTFNIYFLQFSLSNTLLQFSRMITTVP